MTPIHRVLSLLVPLLLYASSARAANWTTIDVPGSPATQTFGINNAGDMVGSYLDLEVWHGYLLSAGSVTVIDPPGSTLTVAWGINDTMQISGYFLGTDGVGHGFLLDGQNFTILDFPGAAQTYCQGINNAGEIVGAYLDANQEFHGFKWSNGSFATLDVPGATFTLLFGITSVGQIVGIYSDADLLYHGFVLNPQGVFRKFAFAGSTAGINDKKIVVGHKGRHSFRFNLNTDVFVKMKFPNALRTDFFGINNFGQIVGDYEDANAMGHGFLRTK